MADPLTINVTQAAASTPASYTVPAIVEVEPLSAFAHWDGAAAATAFYPTLTFYSASGLVLARVFPSSQVAAGGSADVTFAPFLGDIGSAGNGSTAFLDFVDFSPVGNKITITSVLPGTPDLVATTNAITFDGVKSALIQFYASSVDIDQRAIGNTGELLLEFYDNGSALGISASYDATNGAYFNSVCYVTTIITPTSGSHTFALKGYLQGGGGGAVGSTNIYGTGTTTPHVTRPGYLVVQSVTS